VSEHEKEQQRDEAIPDHGSGETEADDQDGRSGQGEVAHEGDLGRDQPAEDQQAG
jgi:hypothetical protein